MEEKKIFEGKEYKSVSLRGAYSDQAPCGMIGGTCCAFIGDCYNECPKIYNHVWELVASKEGD